jgi:hypothetical protein
VELEPDMVTCKGEPVRVLPKESNAAETGFEGHAFFEAASIRKINSCYYILYASSKIHELCYAVSTRPDGPFVYGGTVVSNGDVGYKGITDANARNATGNIHGGLVFLGGKWYTFYHRHTNGTQFSRQGCAEAITIKSDGSIPQVEMTSCGLNGGVMGAKGTTPAYVACNLYKEEGGKPVQYGPPNVEGPFVTEDHEQLPETARVPYITNITDTSVVGFRYLEFDGTEKEIAVSIRGKADGSINVYTDDENNIAIASLGVAVNSSQWTEVTGTIETKSGKYPLRFIFNGEGDFEMNSFTIK